MDGRTDKISFVFYRTSSLWGRCPKKEVTVSTNDKDTGGDRESNSECDCMQKQSDVSLTVANSPSLEAAARRTIGVSSLHSCSKFCRNSVLMVEEVRGYATEKRPQADVREVNQSPTMNESG